MLWKGTLNVCDTRTMYVSNKPSHIINCGIVYDTGIINTVITDRQCHILYQLVSYFKIYIFRAEVNISRRKLACLISEAGYVYSTAGV